MSSGIFRFFEHGGHRYLVELEDLGREQEEIEVRVTEHGALLWSRNIPYKKVMVAEVAAEQQPGAARLLLEGTWRIVRAAIARGRLALG